MRFLKRKGNKTGITAPKEIYACIVDFDTWCPCLQFPTRRLAGYLHKLGANDADSPVKMKDSSCADAIAVSLCLQG